MYGRVENSRKNNHNEPSFSSTLLDEIYRSIDDNYKEDSMYFYRSVNLRGTEERGAGCLVDKWMENDENVLGCTRDSLISGHKDFLLSSSRVSCFSSAAWPKSVRRQEEESSSDDLFKSKSRALKIYASLRKVKQPISPGGKLTSFINSLFNNHAKLKKVGDLESSSSNCSSASSYSRSCLSKNSPKSRDGIQRRVRFADPAVSVILNEESNCGDHSKPPNYNLRRLRVLKNHRKVVDDEDQNTKIKTSDDIRKNYYTVDDDDDDDNDAISDSSSDLFELDHLSLFGHTRFCQELPMYETTHHYGTNRAIFN